MTGYIKKKLFSILTILLVGIYANAQVGINTEMPQGVVHIDPKGNTLPDGTNSGDDIIIRENGRVGIGVLSPTANLHIVGDMKIADGTQNANYVLTSDNDGLGHWKPKTISSVIYGNDANAALTGLQLIGGIGFQYVGVNITLPAGNWQVIMTSAFRNNSEISVSIWWDLSTSATSCDRVGRILSNNAVPGTDAYVMASYFVTPTTTTTYYLWGNAVRTLTYSGLGRIWAIPQ
ncbi:hypothetical protein [Dysgonomonas sp. 520]|uniref:hypothetical protein n=1 Tax=Dysgonomonas sp. 520 TaxID=2302931 RepID=UPI0013D0CF8A|nr:hypothetical protein [Dysgonomonas sp. 520]NDW10817.1 hypothetical protein [Dysgonomonas sp. 520]